jgi:hypothetical protein
MRCTENGQVCTKRRDYVACELCSKKQAQCSRVTVYQRWRIAKQIGVTEERLDLIEAALGQQAVSSRPSKRVKRSSGLRLRLPPPTGRNKEKIKARARANENGKGTNLSGEEPTAVVATKAVPTAATATESVIPTTATTAATTTESAKPTTTAIAIVTLPTADAASLDQHNDLDVYTGDHDVHVQGEDMIVFEPDNDTHDLGEDCDQDVQNDANGQIEDDSDVHHDVEGGEGRGIDLGMCECEKPRNHRNILK